MSLICSLVYLGQISRHYCGIFFVLKWAFLHQCFNGNWSRYLLQTCLSVIVQVFSRFFYLLILLWSLNYHENIWFQTRIKTVILYSLIMSFLVNVWTIFENNLLLESYWCSSGLCITLFLFTISFNFDAAIEISNFIKISVILLLYILIYYAIMWFIYNTIMTYIFSYIVDLDICFVISGCPMHHSFAWYCTHVNFSIFSFPCFISLLSPFNLSIATLNSSYSPKQYLHSHQF